MDDELRDLQRRWRGDPTDPDARRAFARALQRAGVAWETASCGRAGELGLERVVTGWRAETEPVLAGAFSPDGRLVVLATETALHAWEVPEMRREWAFGSVPFGGALGVAISSAGRTLPKVDPHRAHG